jgi:putative ABC transport system permease protein
LAALRRALKASDPVVAASATTTLDALVRQGNALPRLRALVLLAFAFVAVALAGLGSYGVMRQLVASREREFAVRLAFGAVPADLLGAVFAQILRLTVPGVAAGLAAAWTLAGVLEAFVFGIEPRSTPVLLGVSVGVLILAGLATVPSALRASRVDVGGGLAAE